MPLLRNGQLVSDDAWVRLDDEDALPSQSDKNQERSPVLIGLERFLKLNASEQAQISGVWLSPADDVSLLADQLEHVQLIAIDFPAFTDGRGYSHARILRKRFGFRGEIRAMGDVRPDQLLFMMRSGIDAFDFAELPDLELIGKILSGQTR